MSVIEKSLEPILTAQKLLGMFPVTSKFALDKALVATNFLFIQVLLSGSIVLKFVIGYVEEGVSWSSLVEFSAVCLVAISSILWVTYNRHHIAAYLDSCRRSHDRLVALEFRPHYRRKLNMAQVQTLILVSVPLTVVDVIIYDYDIKTEGYLVVYYLADAISFLELLFFMHLVAVAKNHLHLINRFLKAKKVRVLWGQDREVFEELLKIFHEVHGSCKDLNAAFSVPLLTMTAIAFVCMVIDAYHAFSVLTTSLRFEDRELPVMKFTSRISWVTYGVYKMYLLVDACTSFQDQAKDFSIELREILAAADPSQIIETEDLIRTHHLLWKKVDFTAADFYKVDFPLISSIVAAVGSYLVILIQFATDEPTSTQPTNSTPTATASTLVSDSLNFTITPTTD